MLEADVMIVFFLLYNCLYYLLYSSLLRLCIFDDSYSFPTHFKVF